MWPKLSKPSPPVAEAGRRAPPGQASGATSSRLRAFTHDESGAVLALIAIVMPAALGLTALSIDLGRTMNLNTQMQAIADASSIAAAKELDGTEAGLIAATAAAANKLQNYPWLAIPDDSATQIDDVWFCNAPSRCEEDPIRIGDDRAGEAWFVMVSTIQRESRNIFAPVLALAGRSRTSAWAVAGKTVVACNVQPLMLCNPYEPNEFQATRGQMFHFKAKEGASNADYAPGDFGLVDPPGQDSSTGPQLRRLLSQQNPEFCYLNEVSPRPGHNVGNVDDAINVRFDIPITGNTHGMDLTPAPQVIKGRLPQNANNMCNGNYDDLGAGYRYPRDTTWTEYGTLKIGGADMTSAGKDAYWQNHHGTDWPAGVTTRHQAYSNELGLDGTAPAWTGPEDPNPQCAPVSTGDERRRVMSVAIIDCDVNEVQGNKTTDLRSDKYADFFITEPAAGGEIFGEFIELLTPDDEDSRLREIIQLYR